jgi:DNA replication protein DnaC
LIIDDMGMKQLSKRSGEYLFEVIMRRHGLRSTMMTSNRPLEEWGKLIGDVPRRQSVATQAEIAVVEAQKRAADARHAAEQAQNEGEGDNGDDA